MLYFFPNMSINNIIYDCQERWKYEVYKHLKEITGCSTGELQALYLILLDSFNTLKT